MSDDSIGRAIQAHRPIQENQQLRAELKGVREALRRECIDWAEDHTYAQTVATRVGVPVEQVEGDSYGVPGIHELIDMIVAALQKGTP